MRTEFEREGYLVIRNFLSEPELGELTGELDRYISEVVPSLSSEDAFYQDPDRPETLKQLPRMARDPFFDDYRHRSQWNELAGTLLAESFSAKEPQWFNKPPGAEHPTPPHQDNFYFCLKPSNVFTAWLALDHVDDENGCLRFVPGSHLQGLRPHGKTSVLGFSQAITDYGDADFDAEVKIHANPGDLVVHHGETIHRADSNRSTDRHRRAFALVFEGANCREDPVARQRYFEAVASQHEELGLA